MIHSISPQLIMNLNKSVMLRVHQDNSLIRMIVRKKHAVLIAVAWDHALD